MVEAEGAINASGLQSLPKLVFPGGALIGCDAGFLNAPRIKGSHAAVKSGMIAAQAAFAALTADRKHDELESYPSTFEKSWLHDELYRARNFKPWLDKGLLLGSLMFGIDQIIFRGNAPWTLHRRLQSPQATDTLATAFQRIVAERRVRLLAFLGDPKRRSALAQRR